MPYKDPAVRRALWRERYATDPAFRERARERRRSYRLVCPDCGGKMSGGNGKAKDPKRCRPCQGKRRLYWTRARIVDAILLFASRHGRQPTALEWLRPTVPMRGEDWRYPSTPTVQQKFGSWASAIEAAGFARPHSGYHVQRPRPGDLAAAQIREPNVASPAEA